MDQTKETSPDGGGGSNRSDQLRPLLSLLPQRRRAKSPPSINMGSCITNHKGKEIADDETDNGKINVVLKTIYIYRIIICDAKLNLQMTMLQLLMIT